MACHARLLRCAALLLAALALAPGMRAQTKRAKRVGPTVEAPAGVCDTAVWKLVFHDEFEAGALDRSRWATWFTYSHDGSDQCEGCRVMGTSNTIFRDELVTVGDGLLRLRVRASPEEWYGRRTEHAGGMVHTVGDAWFRHGRFEVRCKLPRGKGLWPAFWVFGGETEVDFFECCGEKPGEIKGSLHRWSQPKWSLTLRRVVGDLTRGLHTYAVEWDAEEVRWYLDGRELMRMARYVDRRGKPLPACGRPAGEHRTAPYFPPGSDPVRLILDLAVSDPKGFCKGPKRPKPWPADAVMEVDFVRVYQRRPEAHLRDLCAERALRPACTAPIAPGQHCRIDLAGPAAKVRWTATSGLWISEQGPGHAVVVAKPDAGREEKVRAEIGDDPCGSGATVLETVVAVAR